MSTATYTTPGSSTFTNNTGATITVTIDCWGAGECGAYGTESGNGGNGGEGGGFARSTVSLDPLEELSVVVGAGGTPAGTQTGGDSYVQKSAVTIALAPGGNQFGGTAAVSTVVNYAGGAPGSGLLVDPWAGGGGGGGAGSGGAGGAGGESGSPGSHGTPDGGQGGGEGLVGFAPGGGGGGGSGNGQSQIGGDGADGQVILTYTNPSAGGIGSARFNRLLKPAG